MPPISANRSSAPNKKKDVLPKSRYLSECVHAQKTFYQKTGRERLTLRWKILVGPHAGATFFDDQYLDGGEWKISRCLEAVGESEVDPNNPIDVVDKFVGKICWVDLDWEAPREGRGPGFNRTVGFTGLSPEELSSVKEEIKKRSAKKDKAEE